MTGGLLFDWEESIASSAMILSAVGAGIALLVDTGLRLLPSFEELCNAASDEVAMVVLFRFLDNDDDDDSRIDEGVEDGFSEMITMSSSSLSLLSCSGHVFLPGFLA